MITEFQIFEKNWKPKNVPNWFFLVLRLPTGTFDDTKRKDVLNSLMNMELIQLKGISDHYNISKSWFDVRDILLIMKGSDVMKLNDIEPIEYFNADSFCKNNFKFWRRVTQNSPNFSVYKNQDVAFSSAIRQIFQDLHYKNVKINKKGGLDFNVVYDNNGIIKYMEEEQYVLSNKVSHLYHAGQLKVNNLNDFTNIMLDILKDHAKDYPRTKSYSYAAEFWKKIEDYIINELTFKELKKILDGSFQYLSKVYEREGEWYNNGKSLRIPRGSILYFKQKGKRVDSYSSHGLEPEEIQQIVKDYGLDHIYQVKTVDNHMEMMEILKNEYSNENI